MGVAVAWFGYVTLGGNKEPIINQDYNPRFEPDVAGEILALTAGVLCSLLSILGCATSNKKDFSFSLPYIVLAIAIGLLMLAGGFITYYAESYLVHMKIQACDTIADNQTPAITYKSKISSEYT